MKRMFTWILVLTVLLCLPLLAAAEEAPASDFEWILNDDGGVTITKYVGNSGDVVIPAQIDGKPVTKIGDSAFYDCDNLTSVVLPYGVTSIGAYTFNKCSSLTSVTIPNSVTSIERGAFLYCSSLTSITIPDSVTFIGDNAFYSCSNLTSVTIQNPDIQLGRTVVYDFPLQELVLPENGRYVLTSSGILADMRGENGVTIYGYIGQSPALEIPEQINGQPVTTIGSYAFYSCRKLTSVTIPNSVTSIGEYAFDWCISLTSVTIPDSVTSIGDYAFCASGLTSIIIQNPNIQLGHHLLDGTFSAQLELVFTKGSHYVLTSSGFLVDTAGENGVTIFDYFGEEAAVDIPEQINGQPVTAIGDDVFYDYKRLESITIPDSVTFIGDRVFYNCSALRSVHIPDGVTFIGKTVFYFCFGLASANIPDSVTSISDELFYGCSNLASIAIPDSVTSIGKSAFFGCHSLTSVIIPDSVTFIGEGAFRNCTGLEIVAIPDSVTSIGESAFTICDSLTRIHASERVLQLVGASGFDLSLLVAAENPVSDFRWNANDDGGVTITKYIGNGGYVVIPEQINRQRVTAIGDNAFSGCSSLTGVMIPDSVTSIGTEAFRSCESLTSITIPNSVTFIGVSAFVSCYKLQSVTLSDSITSISNHTFADCSRLTSMIIPDGVTSIGNYAFSLSGLTSITIPDSVTSIGHDVFYGCSNLVEINASEAVLQLVEASGFYLQYNVRW